MLAVNNLYIERNGRAIIQDLSFTLEGQKRLFVQGEIGSGKTTLLLALLGFVPVPKVKLNYLAKFVVKKKILHHFVARLVFVFKMPMINFLAQQCWMILPLVH